MSRLNNISNNKLKEMLQSFRYPQKNRETEQKRIRNKIVIRKKKKKYKEMVLMDYAISDKV